MPYYVIFSFLTLAGIVGNALIIAVLREHEKARTTAEIYIMNMATTDMLMLSMVPLLVTRNIMDYEWIFGDFMCRVYYLIGGLNMFNTVFILTAMSVDRYFCVSRPLRSLDWKTTRTAKIVCALLWAVATVIDLPWVIWADIIPDCAGTPMCLYDFPEYNKDEHFWERLTEIGVLLLSFVIPIILITGTHIGIWWHIRNPAAGLDRTQRSQEKVTRMVFAVVVVFVICWLPKNLAYLAERFDWFRTPIGFEFSIGFEMLMIANSAINPYLYTIFGQHFQRRLMGIFFPAKHRRSMVSRTNSHHHTIIMRSRVSTPTGDRRRHDSAPNHRCLDVEVHVEKKEDRSLSTPEEEANTSGHTRVEDTHL
ncbi:delta-type opioid receptor-like [Branchiostoma floridae]|uniref:Delta-type opioid receptor-like n=2 Tax=Branchiostoma floridae TaxID=7739 RepID=A0A9J7MT17_BRAFL|nr:delta-type opioid receptor-like [Branchiostoma floridae]